MDDLFSLLIIRPVGHALQWLGGTLHYLYGTLIRALRLTKRKAYSHSEYVNGPEDPEDVVFDTVGHRFNNRLLGFLFIGVMLGLLTNC
jgi:hypothetical protein